MGGIFDINTPYTEDIMDKRFWFVELNMSGNVVRKIAPYFTDWSKTLGISDLTPITESQIVSLSFSASITKRLKSLKEGNHVKICRWHRTADIGVYRLTTNDLDLIAKEQTIITEIGQVRSQIKALCGDLVKKERALEIELNKVRKEIHK